MGKILLENLDFEKHHGLGNDYILINNLKWGIPDNKKADLAIKLCKHISQSEQTEFYLSVIQNRLK
ncbi:MAG: hypothetical protein ACTSSC_06825 [Promethearchaeota archaeon]